MRLDNAFHVPVPVREAWDILLDVPRIAPCLPGTVLDGQDGDAYTGRVKIKIGSITASYTGQATVTVTDEAAHTARITASGKEQRGAGRASAQVEMRLVPTDDGTRVEVTTELSITGKAAQFGRGILADVSARLIDQFAANLATEIVAPPAPPEPPAGEPPVAAVPAEPSPPAAAPAPEPVRAAPRPAEPEPFDVLGAVMAGRTRTYAQTAAALLLALVIGLLLGRATRGK
ncbi:Carbon monoxide dehydrogenase subunit G [Thermomonospora echinospora]|uniref:Carbon monoxide dehydrogenase subunit G n=1 Tax=Thermomonospora echinospora TaxID=1992 RepID=A0A1H6E2K8_9ACTN|nr:SRPBCC family protein [Thermomonospora echinospora]SEG91948.1 Carbon monoxide dehydrogenase subunit G [Thermomonospora echinospora]